MDVNEHERPYNYIYITKVKEHAFIGLLYFTVKVGFSRMNINHTLKGETTLSLHLSDRRDIQPCLLYLSSMFHDEEIF